MRLNQVTVPITDLARAVAFYRRLGLVQIVDSPPDYARFELPDGDSTFSIQRSERAPADGATVIYFECDYLDGTVERLQAAGIAFESGPTDQPWLWREAHLRDPDGNMICLYHAGENRKNPPWRLPPEDG